MQTTGDFDIDKLDDFINLVNYANGDFNIDLAIMGDFNIDLVNYANGR